MKFVFLSDTHGLHNHMKYPIPNGDVLIHSGDATNMGAERDISEFIEWYKSIEGFNYKIFISGNHDWGFEKKEKWLSKYINSELTKHNVIYLEDSTFTLRSDEFSRPLNIYGSPWQPRFFDWAFNVNRDKIYKHWEKIPENTDILITHGPPSGILDLSMRNGRTGCTSLRYHIIEKIKPLINCFGHIHEGYGYTKENGISFINASICNRSYQPVNPPIVVNLCEFENNEFVTDFYEYY